MDCWSTPSSLRSSLPWPCKLFSTFSDQFFTIIQIPLLSHSESPKKPNSHVWCFFLLQVKIATQFFIADLAALCVHTLGTPWLTEWWYVWRGNAPTSFQITSKYFTSKSEVLWDSDKWEVRNIDIDSNINIDQDREGDFSANFHLTHEFVCT